MQRQGDRGGANECHFARRKERSFQDLQLFARKAVYFLDHIFLANLHEDPRLSLASSTVLLITFAFQYSPAEICTPSTVSSFNVVQFVLSNSNAVILFWYLQDEHL